MNEIRVLQALQHPSVVRLLDYFDEPKRHVLVLEFVSGGDLFDRILHRRNYSESYARDVMKVLAETVAFMHQKNIVHRDIKPENVLLSGADSDGAHVKICDFGYASFCVNDDLVECLGTVNYMAPEMLRRAPYGRSVDVWSLGVVMFVMLAGAFPFDDRDDARLKELVCSGAFSFADHAWVLLLVSRSTSC